MLSDSSKSAFEMTSEDPQKNIARKYKKNMKLSGFFSALKKPDNFMFFLYLRAIFFWGSSEVISKALFDESESILF